MEVKLTERAAVELKKIMAVGKFGPETFLRLIVNTNGACAPVYKLELDSSKNKTDAVFESHGLVVVVKREDLQSLAGTVIDWREEGLISGFAINNPAAKSTCSCSKTHEQKCSD